MTCGVSIGKHMQICWKGILCAILRCCVPTAENRCKEQKVSAEAETFYMLALGRTGDASKNALLPDQPDGDIIYVGARRAGKDQPIHRAQGVVSIVICKIRFNIHALRQ